MTKLRLKWTPDLNQEFDALTDPNSPFFDDEFVKSILDEYKTFDKFKQSDRWKVLENEVYGNH